VVCDFRGGRYSTPYGEFPRGTKPFQHPGEAPRPFIRPALEAKGDAAVQAAAKEIELGLKEIAEKGQ
jgi:hypothetical protein